MKNMKKIKTKAEPEEPEPQDVTIKSKYPTHPKMRVKPRSKK
ncbi:MAG TPA: hypothetical protein VK469_16170 [Candidatus Kapabacteria bacterium]|nr:hypothetical protein [Candidatus Kapabacteria bacterium]